MSLSFIRTSTVGRTAGYYGSMATFGLMGAAWGPALPFLASSTGSELSRISLIFTALALGSFIGTTLGGRSYDRVPGHIIMVSALVIMAVFAALIPLAVSFWILIICIFVVGAAAGIMTVGANTLLVWIHQENVGPWLNGLHFFSGVGSIISPIIIALILTVSDDIDAAFWILAVIILIPAGWLLVVSSPAIRRTDGEENGARVNYKLLAPVSLIFILYVGAEVAFGGWLYTNSITLFPGEESMAGYLTAAFWGAFTVGRLLGIPVSSRVRSRIIMLINLIGCLISLGLLLTWSNYMIPLWLGTMGLGFFMASIFPTMLTYSEHRMRLTGRVSGIIFGAAAFGGMTIPFLVGQVFVVGGPRGTITVIFFDLLLALVLFVGIEIALQRGSIQLFTEQSTANKS